MQMNIVCVGDCGKDHYLNLNLERLGGCTLNVAMNLRELARDDFKVQVVTCLSKDDSLTTVIEKEFSNRGIELCASDLTGPLPTQSIHLGEDGERRFSGYQEGILSLWHLTKEQIEAISSADMIVSVVYSQIITFFDSLMEVPKKGILVVDFMDMQDFDKDLTKIVRYLSRCNVAVFGLSKDRDSELIDKIIGQFSSEANANDAVAVITLGKHGSMLVGRDLLIEQPATQVPKVVDTTGAGDSFLAAFVASFLVGKSLAESLATASEHAGRVVQKIGGF